MIQYNQNVGGDRNVLEQEAQGGKKSFDRSRKRPVIRASICTGEKTACFQDIETGKLEDVMLLRNREDLLEFLSEYGIREDELTTVY